MWLFYSWNFYLGKSFGWTLYIPTCTSLTRSWFYSSGGDFTQTISERRKSVCTEDDGLRLENVAIVGLNLKVNQDK